MTKVGRDCYSEDMNEEHSYRFSACPRCGARTLDEAGEKCQPSSVNDTGDYWCPGDQPHNPFAVKWDVKGRACHLTNKSAKREARIIQEWCDNKKDTPND